MATHTSKSIDAGLSVLNTWVQLMRFPELQMLWLSNRCFWGQLSGVEADTLITIGAH
jgi:hypothetical protein